jgi:hypothetical protein
MSLPASQMDRRTLLKSLLAASAVAGMPAGAADPVAASNRFHGLFPIAASPFTPEDKLDLDCLSAQVDFCDRARIPGLIWPQIASGWTTLSAPERFAGAEAMLATRKGGQSAVVIGVQTRAMIYRAQSRSPSTRRSVVPTRSAPCRRRAATPMRSRITGRSAARPICRSSCRRAATCQSSS